MGKDEATGGCMSGMIHFLDFHHLLFTTSTGCTRTPKSSSPRNQHCSPQASKGVEAPRNSLELDEVGEEDYYGIPYGVHLVSAPSSSTKKIKKQVPVWVEEEKMSSEVVTPRTPNVVARLMGLEIFPDAALEPSSQYNSPKMITKKRQKKKNCVQQESRQPLQIRRDCNIRFETAGSRSLPESPRVSSERSRDADPRRLSLQLNKENHNPAATKEFSYMDDNIHKKDYCVKVHDGNKSPRSRYYAREIVKQVKENISRRGGPTGSDEYLSKPRRSRIQADHNNARTRPSTSPPPPSPPQEFHIPKPPPPPKTSILSRNHSEDKEKISSRKSKEACYDRFNERIKKHTPPPPRASKSPLSVPCNRGKNFTSSTSALIQEQKLEQDPEYRYVRSILDRAGIMGSTQIRWFSPSLPIDPLIFHQLELDLRGPIPHRCNRKLLFHLVEEILGELSSTHYQHKVSSRENIGTEFLLGRLWRRIKGFPLAECRVLRDIDALVSRDLAESKARRLLQHPSVAAETEVIVLEIERSLLDSVLGEAVTCFSRS